MTDKPTPPLSGGETIEDFLYRHRRKWPMAGDVRNCFDTMLEELARTAALSSPPQDGEREKALEMLQLARLNGQFDAAVAHPTQDDSHSVNDILDAVERALSASGQGGKT